MVLFPHFLLFSFILYLGMFGILLGYAFDNKTKTVLIGEWTRV